MTTHSTLYVGENTHIVQVADLRDYLDVPQNDATVQLTALVERTSGTPVTGATLPITLNNVGPGLYRALLTHALDIKPNKEYYGTFKAVGSQGFRAEWRETCIAMFREE